MNSHGIRRTSFGDVLFIMHTLVAMRSNKRWTDSMGRAGVASTGAVEAGVHKLYGRTVTRVQQMQITYE
jgi:hypothetical protein